MKKALGILVAAGLAFIAGTAFCQPSPDATAPQAAASIPADQQASTEQLTRLFAVMRLRQQLETVTTMMPALVRQQLDSSTKDMMPTLPGGAALTPQQQQAVKDLINSYVEKSMHIYTADEMLHDMTTVYQRHFTRTDVDAYIAFYESPAGRHMLDAQPQIMNEFMPMVMQRVQERSKVLVEQQRKDMQDLVDSFGNTAPPATGAPQPK